MKNILVLALAVILLGCKTEKSRDIEKSIELEYEILSEQPIRKTLELAGEIAAESRHEHAFLVKGQLQSVMVKEGDRVNKGQLIAQISDNDYQQALQIAQSKLDEANDQYNRLSKMYASGSLPAADYEKIKLLRKEAMANLNLYKNKLSYTRLEATLSGVVTRVWAKSGTAVSEGQPIVEISNDNTVFAKIEIPETQISNVNLSDSCSIYLRSLDKSLFGQIYKINPSANRLSRSYEAQILLNNDIGILKDGMLCNVTVYEHAQEFGIIIPLDLIITDINQIHYVDIARNGSVLRKRISFSNMVNNAVIISDGLNIGDTLLVNKPINLKAGQTIKLK